MSMGAQCESKTGLAVVKKKKNGEGTDGGIKQATGRIVKTDDEVMISQGIQTHLDRGRMQ